MLLSALITDFLEYLEMERNVSQLTIRNYGHYLKRFLEFSTDIDPKAINLNLVRKYGLYLSSYTDPQTGKALKRITQNYFLIALRAFLKYLARVNVATLAADRVGLQEWEPRQMKVLDREKFRSWLKIPDSTMVGLRDRAVLETLFYSGLKISQLVNLNRHDTNGGNELDKYLKARKDTFTPLFIRFQGRVNLAQSGEAMRLSARSIQRIVEKYAKKTDF